MTNIQQFLDELNDWGKHKITSQYPAITHEQLQQNGIVVYGASTMGNAFVSQLVEYGITPKWIVDKSPALHGDEMCGIPIRPPETLAKTGDSFVLLASTHIKEMAEVCDSYHARWILPYSIHSFCPLLLDIGIIGTGDDQTEELSLAIQLMADQKSVDIFKAFVRYHHIFDNDFSELCAPVEYFPDDLKQLINYSFFADAGAFNGDTLKTWISHRNADGGDFAYYAFEPSQSAYAELESFVKGLPFRDKVHLFNKGLGAESFQTAVIGDANGMSTIANKQQIADTHTNTSGQISVDTIDNLLRGKRVTAIKADIEGFEMDMLRGAEQTIREQRPALLISVYHKYSDLYKIPLWIDSLNLDYDIYMRHAPRVFTDTTCCAIPRK